MNTTIFSDDDRVNEAASLSYDAHSSLRSLHPWLPPHTRDQYEARLGWIMRNGSLIGAFDGRRLAAFVGYFPIEDFRNAGPGAFTPDWCLGIAPGCEPALFLRPLIRDMLADLSSRRIPLHAVGIPSDRSEWRETFELTGYGRIVLDAARSRDDLLADLLSRPGTDPSVTIRRATKADAPALASMDASLASHIGASPVLMPSPHGRDAGEWARWFDETESVAFLAVSDEVPIGFMKAQQPQFDVSFAVHGEETLAINGLFVEPGRRYRGIARALLTALVREAVPMKKTVVSVDCETTNPEAYGFWTRFFVPVSWSLERRY